LRRTWLSAAVARFTTTCHLFHIDAELLVPASDHARPDEDEAERGPGRGIRLFVGAFLGLFLITGLVGVEAWPLTGWRLYSRLRHGDFWAWQVLAVGADGIERSVDLGHLPPAYHGVPYLLNDFAGLPVADREGACLALAVAARAQYSGVVGVAVDHVLGRIPVDPEAPPSLPSRRIRVHQCTLD
jgi:hypothetical protein